MSPAGLRRASGAALLALLHTLSAVPAMSAHRTQHCRHCGRPILLDHGDFGAPNVPFESAPLGNPPDMDFEIEPQFTPERSPAPGPLPYPQGFVLNVPVRPNPEGPPVNGTAPGKPLDRYRDVANALAACWSPPATFEDLRWRQVTLRLSLKRDGSINGTARIPYVDQGLTPGARSGLTQSLAAALRRCTPLPLSPGLGAAIAGQIFALRFIEQDADDDR